MKKNPDFTLRNIGDIYLIVPIMGQTFSSKKVIHTNETGAFLWECLQKENTEKGLLAALKSIYDIDDATALSDIKNFLDNLQNVGAIIYD